MKGSPCCAGLMRSCLHTYRTKTNLTQHIIQPWGGGASGNYGGGASVKYGGVINQLWGGHQPTMGGHQPSMGGSSTNYGGVINQLWGGPSANYGGGHQPSMGGSYFPTSMYRKSKSTECTGSQNPQNYFSNTYVLPSVNRTAGPMKESSYLPTSCRSDSECFSPFRNLSVTNNRASCFILKNSIVMNCDKTRHRLQPSIIYSGEL